jgi:anti-sigma B factor antagonist
MFGGKLTEFAALAGPEARPALACLVQGVLAVSVERYPVRWAGTLAVVTLPVEIDIANAEQIRAALLSVLDQGTTTLVLDMTATTFCDSAGVHALVAARSRAAASGAELRLAASSAPVLRIFAITGLDQLITIYAGLDEATGVAGPDQPTDLACPDQAAGKPPVVLGNSDTPIPE